MRVPLREAVPAIPKGRLAFMPARPLSRSSNPDPHPRGTQPGCGMGRPGRGSGLGDLSARRPFAGRRRKPPYDGAPATEADPPRRPLLGRRMPPGCGGSCNGRFPTWGTSCAGYVCPTRSSTGR